MHIHIRIHIHIDTVCIYDIYIYIYVYIYRERDTYTYIHIYVVTHLCIPIYTCVYMYVYIYIYTFVHTYVYIHICVCMRVMFRAAHYILYVAVRAPARPQTHMLRQPAPARALRGRMQCEPRLFPRRLFLVACFVHVDFVLFARRLFPPHESSTRAQHMAGKREGSRARGMQHCMCAMVSQKAQPL